jgi:two-component system LytT family response regulator
MGLISRYTILIVLAHLVFSIYTLAETAREKDLLPHEGEGKQELLNRMISQSYKKRSYDRCITFAQQALELICRSRPDLVFLDIHLPDMNGFQVLEKLPYEPAVIFTTAYDQYAVKAFEVNSVDYLLKPVAKERLETAIARVMNLKTVSYSQVLKTLESLMNRKSKHIRFSIQKADQLLVIPQEEVYYFEVKERYLYLCTYDSAFFYNATLKQLEESLDPDLFLRINKSNIVSLDKIRCLKKDYMNRYRVILKDKNSTKLKISRHCLKPLREKLDNLLL